MPLTFDMHVHFAWLQGAGATDRFVLRRPNVYMRAFLRQLGLSLKDLEAGEADAVIQRRFLAWCGEARVDRLVLLAMDGACDEEGRVDPAATAWVTDNDDLAAFAAGHAKLLWGASVHPYRPDALQRLERCLERGACLVKWIPSTQGIRLDDRRCAAFYEVLAHYGVPLLVHTGNEHVSSRSRNGWNDPALLVHPLKRGVTVIAAHCGARMFLHERCYFGAFARLAGEHERLYGDISAFGIPTRIGLLRRLMGSPDLLGRILYGSDFPAFVMPWSFVLAIGWRGVREVTGAGNPLDRPYLLMRAMGLPDAVFTRAGSVLRLPAGACAEAAA